MAPSAHPRSSSSLSASRTPRPRPILVVSPVVFGAYLAVALALWDWPLRWLLSGTPVLTWSILLGASKGYRVLQIVPLWTLLTTLNLAYAVAATSWLLYALFTSAVYPAIFLTCLFQFDYVARTVRRALRKFITRIHFVDDTIALFDIPALEIDVDVDGLMVVRGLTISLSTLTVVAHGIEVGIKVSDDIELAISTERVTVSLFRGIEIGDCFANVKGGLYEMTFGEVAETERDEEGDAVMVEATPLLRAAEARGDTSRPRMVKMKSQMTRGREMQDSAVRAGLRSMRTLHPEDKSASDQYDETLRWIDESSTIGQCRRAVRDEAGDKIDSEQDERAAICSKMQTTPTVPHPPKRSIKVTTLQNLSGPRVRGLLHRLPMLLRLLLNPISYLHPVSITSISATGSGRWISFLLKTHLFREYAADSRGLRRLEKRVLSWLADANFAFQFADIQGLASVPFLTAFDITALLKFGEVIAYRTLEKETALEQVLRLGGADAAFTIPAFLLPHHEHLLPPVPTASTREELAAAVVSADGKPEEVRAEHRLEQAEEDEASVRISAHVQLPACFSQDLLNFIAALVKASKVVDMEKAPGAMEEKLSGVKEFGHAVSKGVKDGVKKTVVDGIVSDRWIAKAVGKVTRMLQEAQGDVGYSGDIPVKLDRYRLPAGHPEAQKILA